MRAGCLEEPLGRDDRQKKMHTQKEANQKTRKPPQPYKSLLLMRLRTAKKKKKTNGYLMEALTRMMRTGRRKNSSDNQYSVTVSVANENGSVM